MKNTSSTTVCKTSPTKQFRRRTKAEIDTIERHIYEIAHEDHPVTVRQIYYRVVARGIIRKTEGEYKNTIGRLTVKMRRSGVLPFHWIADSTRWMRKPNTYSSMEAALANTALCYRRALWADQDVYVEIWLEKEALAGVLVDVTDKYDVPLMVCRGYPSISFLHGAAETIRDVEKPVFIYYFGDRDPSGIDIDRYVEREIRSYAPDADMCFERVAVTEEQIDEWNLPTRPTKQSDTRARNFTGESTDVDAIHPKQLRQLVETVITEHLDMEEYRQLLKIESAEREVLDSIVEQLPGLGADDV